MTDDYSTLRALAYHERTKHHFHRYAASSGYLDWANQPDPFRRYADAPLHLLPLAQDDGSPAYDDLYAPLGIPPQPLGPESLGALFEHAFALSAWKEHHGSRWELRCNPSSGNLHPTEAYLIAGPDAGLHTAPAVYHYAPKEHALERRCELDAAAWNELTLGFPKQVCFAGLSSIHWREAWKYGERAYRYCNHDMGHAIAALSFSAAALGWRSIALDALADSETAALLGLDRDADFRGAEREHPDVILAIVPVDHGGPVPRTLPERALAAFRRGTWTGHANPLSKSHTPWEIIPAAARACAKPRTTPAPAPPLQDADPLPPSRMPYTANRIALQRRSAVAMDGLTGMPLGDFCRMLRRTLPDPARPPWHTMVSPPNIHLLLFVHRVDGLDPGLYVLCRETAHLPALRAAMRADLAWAPPQGGTGDLPIYGLETGDARAVAAQISCHQEIAGDGAFSVGMLAQFAAALDGGDWNYPRLFWEAGVLGQVLYLEAEAAGLRGTGIGCYFDDAVHSLLGLCGSEWQSLYHFTVGTPLDDPRLRTLAPYADARRKQR